MSYEIVTEENRDPNKIAAKGTFILEDNLIRELGPGIELTPDVYPDVFGLGHATHFDSVAQPGFVWVHFDTGNMMRVPNDMFVDIRFKLDPSLRDQTGKYAFKARGPFKEDLVPHATEHEILQKGGLHRLRGPDKA